MDENTKWLYEEAKIAYDGCDYEKSYATLLRVLELDTANPGAQELLIQVQKKRQKPSAELRAAEEYFRNNPGNTSLKKLAFTLKSFTRYHAARERFRDILKDTPNDTDAMSALGLICTSLEDYGEAITLLEETRLKRPGDSDVLFALGLCYNHTGRVNEALEIFEGMKINYSSHEGVSAWLGRCMEKLGRKTEAYACYIEELRKHPAYPDGVKFLAEYYADAGDKASCEEVYAEGIAAAKKSSGDLLNMGTMLVRQRRFEQGRELFNHALDKEPPEGYSRSLMLNNLGVSYLDVENGKKAMEYFKKALEVFPLNHNALHNMGLVMRMQNRFDEAKEYLLRALELEPDWHITLALLGEVYFRCYDTEKGREYYTLAIGRRPKKSRYYAEMALHLHNSGLFKEAKDVALKAMELNPTQPSAAAVLVKYFCGNFEIKKAAGYLEVLENNPDYRYMYLKLRAEVNAMKEHMAGGTAADLNPYIEGKIKSTEILLNAGKLKDKAQRVLRAAIKRLDAERWFRTRYRIFYSTSPRRGAYEINMEEMEEICETADIFKNWLMLIKFTDTDEKKAEKAAKRVGRKLLNI